MDIVKKAGLLTRQESAPVTGKTDNIVGHTDDIPDTFTYDLDGKTYELPNTSDNLKKIHDRGLEANFQMPSMSSIASTAAAALVGPSELGAKVVQQFGKEIENPGSTAAEYPVSLAKKANELITGQTVGNKLNPEDVLKYKLPNGKTYSLPNSEENLAKLKARGISPLSANDIASQQLQNDPNKQGIEGSIDTFVRNALDNITFGATRELGGEEEQRKTEALNKEHHIAHWNGTLSGIVAGGVGLEGLGAGKLASMGASKVLGVFSKAAPEVSAGLMDAISAVPAAETSEVAVKTASSFLSNALLRAPIAGRAALESGIVGAMAASPSSLIMAARGQSKEAMENLAAVTFGSAILGGIGAGAFKGETQSIADNGEQAGIDLAAWARRKAADVAAKGDKVSELMKTPEQKAAEELAGTVSDKGKLLVGKAVKHVARSFFHGIPGLGDAAIATGQISAQYAAKNAPRLIAENAESVFSKLGRLSSTVAALESDHPELLANAITNATTYGKAEANIHGDSPLGFGVSEEQKLVHFKQVSDNITQLYSNDEAKHDLIANTGTVVQAGTNSSTALNQYVNNIHNIIQHSYDIMPKQTTIPKPFSKLKWEPTASEMNKFFSRYQMVVDPMSALQHLKDNTLTDDQIDTLKIVHPNLFASMQTNLLHMAGQPNAPELASSKRHSVDKILGSQGPNEAGFFAGLYGKASISSDAVNPQASHGAPKPARLSVPKSSMALTSGQQRSFGIQPGK